MTSPDDRPDPLAPLPERPKTPPGPDLSVCSHMSGPGGQHCGTPPAVILWMGCQRGEHAGPLAYCAAHVTPLRQSMMVCAQCRGTVRIMKITSMDGTSTVGYPDPPGPPPDLWREAAPGA